MPTFELEHNGQVFDVDAADETQALEAFKRMIAGEGKEDTAPSPETVAATPPRRQGVLAPISYEEGSDDWQWDMDAGLPGMAKDLASGVKDFAIDSAKKIKYLGERARDAVTGPDMSQVATTMDNGDMFDKDGKFLGNSVMLGEADASAAQRVGELFTPTSPAMGTGKGIAIAARQSAGRTSGQQVAQAGKRIGVDIPRAVATDDPLTQFIGKKIAETPLVGGALQDAGERSLTQLDDAMTATTRGYGVGAPPGAVGSALRNEITTTAKKTIPDFVSRQYDAVDKLVTPNVVSPLSKTAEAAKKIVDERILSARSNQPSAAIRVVQEALDRKDGLTYEGLKRLRTSVGEMLDDQQRLVAAGIEQGELKRIYGALTDDLQNAVKRASPDGKAFSVWKQANAAAKRAAEERAGLDKLLRVNSDEALVARLGQMASDKSTANIDQLLRARSAVSKETWNELAAATLQSMGRDANGHLTPDRFVTAWGKLSPTGKKALFGGDKALYAALEDIATVSSRFREINQLANTSRTGASVNMMATLAAMWAAPWATLGTLGGAAVYGRLLARPEAVKALASYGKGAAAAASGKASAGVINSMRGRAQILAAVLLKEGVVQSNMSVQELAASLIGEGNAVPVE